MTIIFILDIGTQKQYTYLRLSIRHYGHNDVCEIFTGNYKIVKDLIK